MKVSTFSFDTDEYEVSDSGYALFALKGSLAQRSYHGALPYHLTKLRRERKPDEDLSLVASTIIR